MQKPLALSIAACLGLTGCTAFQKSETWTQAVSVRPAETTHDADPSNAYAAKLHAAFVGQGIEHKVVVYQYHYTTRRHETAIGTRTAVIYRDDSNPNYPWWLKDDRLNNPFWLPGGSLDKQISFYIRRKAEVIEVKEYPAGGRSGKTSLAFAKAQPKMRSEDKDNAVVSARPKTFAKPVAKMRSEPLVAEARVKPVKKAPAPAVARKTVAAPAVVRKTAPAPMVARKTAPVTKVVRRQEVVKAAAPAARKTAPVTKVVKRQEVAKVPVTVARKTTPVTKVVKREEVAVKAPVTVKRRASVTRTQPATVTKGPAPVAKGPSSPIKTLGSIFTPKPAPVVNHSPVVKKEAEPLEPITSRNTGGSFWSPPTVLDPEQQPALTAPRDAHLEKLFRAKHGTDYNRFSPTDRRKMQQLQQGVASRE